MRTRAQVVEKSLRYVLLSVAVLTIILIAFAGHFRELSDPFALDMAQIARNLADGKGYTTSNPTPLGLAMVGRLDDHPELHRPPAYVATLAATMRVLGATDRVVALTSTIFLILSAAAIFFLGARLFGAGAGIISLLAFVSIPSVLRAAVSGTDATFLALVVTVFFLLLAAWRAAGDDRSALRAVGLGLICGIAYLTRHEMLVLLIVALVFVALHQRRRAILPVAVTLAVFAVVVTPWLWRSFQLTGQPIASLEGYDLVTRTTFNPEVSHDLRFNVPDIPPVQHALSRPLSMARKLVAAGLQYYENMPRMYNVYLIAFFMVGLLLAISLRRHALLHIMALLTFVLVAITLSLYGQINSVVISLVPIVIVFAVGWIVHTIGDAVASFGPRTADEAGPSEETRRWLGKRTTAALVIVTLLIMTPLWPFLFRHTPPQGTPLTNLAMTLADRSERVFTSDISTALAWHTDKIVVPLPRAPATLLRMTESGLRIDAIYLSPEAMQMPPPARLLPWLQWLLQEDPPGRLILDQRRPGLLWELPQ